MSTFEEAVDIVSNKMNKTLSNDELKEVPTYIVFIPTKLQYIMLELWVK